MHCNGHHYAVIRCNGHTEENFPAPCNYECEATSVAGFIQQIAVAYVARGYLFYVAGRIPSHKDPLAVDRKLIARYGIAISRSTRARRKKAGKANLQYIRHGRQFVLLATPGTHAFLAAEGSQVKDIREVPLKLSGYSISFRQVKGRGRAGVRIERRCFRGLKSLFSNLAHEELDILCAEFRGLRFEPYAGVRWQLLKILSAVNRARRAAGLEIVPLDALRLRRRQVRPFD